MGSLNRILAATDLSTPARHAAERAALLSRQTGAPLELLHVAPRAPMQRLQHLVQAGCMPGNIEQRLLDSAGQRLGLLADLLSQRHGVQAGTQAVSGELLATLQAEADAHQAGLIVLGSHGESTMRHLLLGSTAERLLNAATRPMLVVRRAPQAPYRSVLVPVDFSASSTRAIQAARDLAPEAHLTLLHVFDVPFEGSLRYAAVSEAEIDQYRIAARGEAMRRLQELATSVKLAATEADLLVLHGEPSLRIASQAQELDADLIVMGKHGDNLLERLFLGSVTRRVLGEAQSDVLVSV